MKSILGKIGVIFFACLLLIMLIGTIPAMAGTPVNGVPDHNSVYDYAINSVVQIEVDAIAVEAQANYCYACNPNDNNDPGCAAFTHGFNPTSLPSNYWCWGNPGFTEGRYIAIRVMDGTRQVAEQKLVLNSQNWPIGSIRTYTFRFDGLTGIQTGDLLTIYADTFCSWCGHYYPAAAELKVKDLTPPKISCLAWVNPSGKNIPSAGDKSKNGNNPDGFYQITATDFGDPSPQIYIGTKSEPRLFGPFANPIIIKFTKSPGAIPEYKKIGSIESEVNWHVILPDNALITAVDVSGNEDTCECVLVPPSSK